MTTPDNRALRELVEKLDAQVKTLRQRAKNQRNYCGDPLPGQIELLNQAANELEAIASSVNRVDIREHADDVAVDTFANAMKNKLAEARQKGRSGWNDKNDCSQKLLSDMLHNHVEKGDPRDVANFCMFLYMRGEAILERPVVVGGWFPIESAPKDGTKILAVSGRYGVRETYWRFYGEGSPAKAEFDRGEGPSGAWDWSEPMNHWASSWTPAYWMPLPAAPEANESMVRGKS